MKQPNILALTFVVIVTVAGVAMTSSAHAGRDDAVPPTSSRASDNEHQRIVVIGDVHGDLPQLKAMLRLAALIDENGNWTGGNTTLVQMGDLLDRGPDDRDVMDFMMQLRNQSLSSSSSSNGAAGQGQGQGGEVVILLGNHELMNIMNQFHYVHPLSNEPFGGSKSRKRAFAATGHYGQFLRSLPAAHQVGSTLFVHAGLTARFAKLGLHGINAHVKEAIAQEDWEAAILGTHGPLWTRDLAMREPCSDLEHILQLYNNATMTAAGAAASTATTTTAPRSTPRARRIVVGHTPQRDGHVRMACDGRLLLVDVGLSKWMHGHLSALEIEQQLGVAGDANDDDALGDVTISEIMAEKVKPPSGDDATAAGLTETTTSGDASSSTTNGESEPADVEELLKKDPSALQELSELLREVNDRQRRDSEERNEL